MNSNLDDEKKVSVLVSALEERYRSIHTIRDRIQSICTWSLGLLLASSGWLLQSGETLNPVQKVLSIIGILGAFTALRFVFLADLNRGFRGQQRVAARIEKTLGFYKPQFFDDESTALYPEEWMKAGAENGKGSFFASTYLLLYIGVSFFVIAILLNGFC